jgi:hypothetical protein
MKFALGIALDRVKPPAGAGGGGDIPVNAILFNGVPLLYNGEYITFTNV